MDGVFIEQKSFFDLVCREIKDCRVSHAYLIESFDYKNINQLVDEFIKLLLCKNKVIDKDCHCKLCYLIDEKKYPDVQYVYPDGNFIKKEQLINIKELFKNKSSFDNKQIYVITDATKLNSSSANTMLKFLEEPEDNIIAILVADNKYKVIDTILSRCQVISLNNIVKQEMNEEISKLTEFLCERDKNFSCYDEIIKILFDKKETINKLKLVQQFLFKNINNDEFYLNNKEIISIISVIDNNIEKFEYNVNHKLSIDNLLISIMEVLHESC